MKATKHSPGGLNYVVWGAKELPTLILLHGFLGQWQEWEAVGDALQTQCQIIAVDLPGHGQSVGLPDAAYSIPFVIREIGHIIEGTRSRSCHLLGYSMGARLALATAIRYPAQVRSLALVSGSPGLKTAELREARLAMDYKKAMELEETSLSQFVNDWYNQSLFALLKNNEALRQEIINRREENDKVELAKALCGLSTGAQPSYWDSLADLNMPVLLVVGKKDDKFMGIAREMAELFPRCRLRGVLNAGHVVYREAPSQFVDEVRTFLVEEGY